MENQQPPQDPQPIISNQSPQNQFTNTPSKSRSHSRSRSPSHNSQESFQDPNEDQIARSNKPNLTSLSAAGQSRPLKPELSNRERSVVTYLLLLLNVLPCKSPHR